MMAKQKKPRNKAYRPKDSCGSIKLRLKMWRVNAVTDPLYAIIDQLEQSGTIDEINGEPVFKDCRSGKWCDSVSAIEGTVEFYGIHEIRSGCQLELDPIQKLAAKLKYGMPVFPSDTVAARAAVDRIRDTTMEMTEDYSRQLLSDFRLKLHIEAEVGASA